MRINNSKDPMSLQTPKQTMKNAPSEETRETQRMKAEEARKLEDKQPRQVPGPDGAGLQVNIQA